MLSSSGGLLLFQVKGKRFQYLDFLYLGAKTPYHKCSRHRANVWNKSIILSVILWHEDFEQCFQKAACHSFQRIEEDTKEGLALGWSQRFV